MEDILSIISLLLVAVIPVIQKSMKKKQEKRRQSMVKSPAKGDDASTPIARRTETEQDNLTSFDERFVIEAEQKRPKVVKVPRANLVASISEPIPQHNDVSTFPPEATETDVADDFDFRKAILYSEILKPKF